MIVEQEDILVNGKIFRFETEPVDPSDPFRGKYITLDFKDDTFKHYGTKWQSGETVYVILTEDNDGFARIADVSDSPPRSEVYYVQGTVLFSDTETVRISYPFERFYMEESKAPGAEKLYQDVNRNDSSQTAYAIVRIKNGKPALEAVMIDDRSIVELVKELKEENEVSP
jgi:uncharacterized membrane-anchored protein